MYEKNTKCFDSLVFRQDKSLLETKQTLSRTIATNEISRLIITE